MFAIITIIIITITIAIIVNHSGKQRVARALEARCVEIVAGLPVIEDVDSCDQPLVEASAVPSTPAIVITTPKETAKPPRKTRAKSENTKLARARKAVLNRRKAVLAYSTMEDQEYGISQEELADIRHSLGQ